MGDVMLNKCQFKKPWFEDVYFILFLESFVHCIMLKKISEAKASSKFTKRRHHAQNLNVKYVFPPIQDWDPGSSQTASLQTQRVNW